MTCAFGVWYEHAAIFPLSGQSTRCPEPGYLPFIDQTFLGYILVPICYYVLRPGCWCNLPSSNRPVGCIFALSQRLNGTSCCTRQTGDQARKRKTKTKKFDIGTTLQKRDEPGLVTATTTLYIPI